MSTAAGANGANDGARTGSVELRRFRSWQPQTEARPGWAILVRYHVRTMLRTWYTSTLLVIVGVLLLLALGIAVSGWTDPHYPTPLEAWDIQWGVATLSLLPAGIFALVVGAPLFAEDLRYNAPLFYFSRPLRPGTYFRGKLTFLGGVLLAVGFVPVVLILLLGLLLRPAGRGYAFEVASDADALHALAVVVPGVLVSLLWMTAVVLLVSVHTRRTWHAAMGVSVLVGAWSLLGSSASVLADSALRHVWGPAGWYEVLFVLPLDARYMPRQTYTGADGVVRSQPLPSDVELWGLALVVVYAVMLATALAALWWTNRRLRRVEGLL